jgi:mRNA-degrading endonuclease RelE of RelBE toxin-antitoxin system
MKSGAGPDLRLVMVHLRALGLHPTTLTLSLIKIMIQVMKERPAYSLKYARATVDHLRAIEPKYHSLIREAIEQQLRFEPDHETRNRKRVGQPNSIDAEWEIRFGPDNRFRVFYTVDPEEREVEILAIGVKDRNRLFIGGEEEEL